MSKYRSSLLPMIELMKSIKEDINVSHKAEFNKTVFGRLFLMFCNASWMTRDTALELHAGVQTLVNMYTTDDDGFKIGTTVITLKPRDIALIFGLPLRGEVVEPFSGTTDKGYRNTRFFQDNLPSVNAIRKTTLDSQIKTVVKIKGREEDFVKLMIMHMACTFMFSTASGTEIQASFVWHLKDYKTINSISWPTVIHNHLMKMMLKEVKGEVNYSAGCTILLLYWIAERTTIVKPIQDCANRLPRAARWNLKDVATAVEERLLLINRDHISKAFSNVSSVEKKLLETYDEESDSEELTHNDQIAMLIDDNLEMKRQLDEAEDQLSFEVKKNAHLEEINQELIDRITVLQKELEDKKAEILLKDKLLRVGKIESDSFNGVAEDETENTELEVDVERMKDDRADFTSVSTEDQGTSGSIKGQTVEGCKGEKDLLKDDQAIISSMNVNEGTASPTKDMAVENSQSLEMVVYTGTPTFQLLREEDENDTAKPVTRSIVRRIKKRERIPKVFDPNEYETQRVRGKKAKGVVEAKTDDMGVVCSQVQVKSIKKSPIWKYLKEGDEASLMLAFFACYDAEYACYMKDKIFIFPHMIKALMWNEFVEGQIIDWYVDRIKEKYKPAATIVHTYISLRILSDASSKEKKKGTYDFIEHIDSNNDVIIFPMNSAEHWMLLVYDPNQEYVWQYYDSMNRRGNSVYLRDAKKIAKRVMTAMNESRNRKNMPLISAGHPKEVKRVDVPQQLEPDCALHVCHHMKRIACGINNEVGDLNKKTQRMRAKISYNIIKDRTYGKWMKWDQFLEDKQ